MKHLNIACYGSNFDNYDHLYDILTGLQSVPVGVELSLFSAFSDKPDFNNRLRKQVKRFAEFYTTFHAPHLEIEATLPLDSAGHRDIIDAFKESFEIYHAFSAASIVMHTHQRAFLPGEKAELQANSIATILEIAQLAEDEEINLLVENVGEGIFGNLLFDEDEFIQLFNEFPNHVNCLIDIGHANINKWNMEKVISSLKHRITAYHLHNNDGKGDTHRPLFESGMEINPAEWISVMERFTPDADWVLEYAPGNHITRGLMIEEVGKLLKLLQ